MEQVKVGHAETRCTTCKSTYSMSSVSCKNRSSSGKTEQHGLHGYINYTCFSLIEEGDAVVMNGHGDRPCVGL